GFPTETDEMFQTTVDNVKAWGLQYLHVFPYSKRPGTPAERMPQVLGNTIKSRAKTLRDLGATALAIHMDTLTSTRQAVLVEKEGFGRTESFAPVKFVGAAPQGEITKMTILGHDKGILRAKT
ncbi:MAG: tRNA (N(6)-L-threonylcarbamoyladenosine(37)-C(2))-methylthiotransferase MtaB, partial [Magnetovibrio sp.]|nr:tRNA (N(6)-L-threonylcarbamoyladenosine(37)-C(2))-methylthiotransferase MtaB [Magnetovibrio sp.]